MLLDVLEAQIIALRASVDAMYAAIRAARTDAPPPTDSAGCPHLEVENVGTFGLPEWQCKSCGATVIPHV
jgi:hypothetical protein